MSDARATKRSAAAGRPLLSEIGQSFYLMALMAAALGLWLGLGLLAVRLLG